MNTESDTAEEKRRKPLHSLVMFDKIEVYRDKMQGIFAVVPREGDVD